MFYERRPKLNKTAYRIRLYETEREPTFASYRMHISYDVTVCEYTEGCGQSLTMVVLYAWTDCCGNQLEIISARHYSCILFYWTL